MKIDTQFLEDHQARLTVEFEAEVLAAAKRRAAQQLAKKYKIPGFRPGKAPYNVVERYIGESAIVEGAVELVVNDNYPKVLDQAGIKPYGPGSLEEIKSLEPPTFQFIVPLEAEVTLGDYRAVRMPYDPPAVADEDVDKVLEDLRDRQAVIEPVERPVESGDEVHLKLSAQRKQVEEGQSATLIQERHQTLVVQKDGQEDQDEWPFVGFSRHLVGATVGSEVSVEYTYPGDYTYESLQNVAAEFHAVVEEVKSRTLPEIDDELAKTVSDFDTLAELRSRIRAGLEENNRSQYDAEYTDKIITELVGQSTVKFPPQMLDREVDTMVGEISRRLEQRNMDFQTYLKSRQIDEAAFRTETRPAAENRLKRSLVMLEVGRKENIEVKPDEVQSQTAETLNQLGQSLPEKEARRLNNSEFIYQLVGNITADMFSQKTLEQIRAIAKGEAASSQADAEIPPEAGAEPQAAGTPEAAASPAVDAPPEAGSSRPKRSRARKASQPSPTE